MSETKPEEVKIEDVWEQTHKMITLLTRLNSQHFLISYEERNLDSGRHLVEALRAAQNLEFALFEYNRTKPM